VQVALDPPQLARDTVSSAIRSSAESSNKTCTNLAWTHALPRSSHAPSTAARGPRTTAIRMYCHSWCAVQIPICTPLSSSGSDQAHSGSVRKPRPNANPVTPAQNEAVPIPNESSSHASSRHDIGSVIAERSFLKNESPCQTRRDRGTGIPASAPRTRSKSAHQRVTQRSP
jgi:hypothetical protein